MAGLKFDAMPDVGDPRAYFQQKKPKDFWTDQISTAGGILGGIAGLPLGIFGAGGGSALGSGLGEAIENSITGDDPGKNVAQEAVLGGVFGAGPIRLTKAILGAGRGAAAQGGAAAATNIAGDTTKAALPQIGQEPLKTSLQGKMQTLGNKALLSQYGTVPAPIARQTNPAKTVGELADYGITSPEDAERIGRAITGSGGIINKAVAKSVDGAAGVNTDGLRRVAEDALALNGVVEKDAKSVLSIVDAQLRRLQGGPTPYLNAANPNDALDVLKALEKRIADLTGRGGNARLATAERSDQAKALQALHDEVEDRLYRGAGADKNLSRVLTPEVREQLVSLKPGDPSWQQYVDGRVMGAKSVQDLRSAQSPFVRVSKIIDEADQNELTAGGRGGNMFNSMNNGGGLVGALTSAGANLAQPVLARYGGQALRNNASKAPNGLLPGATRTPKPNTAGGVAGRVGVAAPLISGGINAVQNQLASPTEPPDLATAINSPTQQPRQQGSPYPRENLMADIQRDPKNAEKYISQYQALQEIYAPADSGLNATQLETANRAQNALKDLGVLEQAIESGDIVKTAVPGSGSALGGNLLGTTDIEAALFNIGDVILRSRTGAQAPESEIRAFVAGYLPRGGESRESQVSKLERAYRELAGMANPVVVGQAGVPSGSQR